MAYFALNKEMQLIVDASPVELSLDTGRQSESLSDVEKRYSQTEKGALVIVCGCKHFNLLSLWHPNIHKPLETIFNNPKNKPPARVEG